MALQKNKQKYKHLSYAISLAKVLYHIITPFVRWFFRTSSSGVNMLSVPSPYILLAQHSSVWDPIVYNTFIKKELHFIVSDAHFRNPIVRFLLRLVGSIAKKKLAKDMRSIAEIMYVLKRRKESICIFPEGINTWDGTSSPIISSTAKLIKHAGLPVICAKSHGAYLTFPRWARGPRRGTWKVSFSLCLTPKEISEMNEEEILKQIEKHLYNNEYENQKKQALSFVSSRSAEYIERVLFACPCCESVQNIVSKKTCFYCRVCCNLWRVKADGTFVVRGEDAQNNPNVFSTVVEWNTWQKNFIREVIKNHFLDTENPIFYDKDVVLKYGKSRLIKTHGTGSITLNSKNFIFTPDKNTAHIFCIKDMYNINVQNNEKLEWTSPQGITYQIRAKNPRVNTYKYMVAMEMLNKN